MFKNAYRNKRVLVTGHTGFKGSWLCEWLLDLGAQVGGFSIDVPSDPSHYDVLKLDQRVEHHAGDIRDLGRLREVFNRFCPEIVFHLAAQPLVRFSYDHPKETFDTNVGGTLNILEAIRGSAIQAAVFVATDKCYENREWEYGYRESDPLGGKDPYSASKAGAEIVFHSYFKAFFDRPGAPRLASARAGNVIGGGDWASDRIVPDCVRSWAKGKDVVIRNPESTRPWQHVLEPLSGYLWLGACLLESRSDVNGESFNFGPRENASQKVSHLIDEMGKGWENHAWRLDRGDSEIKKEANFLRLCCDKAHSRLAWHPILDFSETVGMTSDWYRQYYNNANGIEGLTLKQIHEYQEIARARQLAWTV